MSMDTSSRYPGSGFASQSNGSLANGSLASGELSTGVLMQVLYQDLRSLARAAIHGESPGQTLQPTALVHEVFLRLHKQQQWCSAQHFYATAATTMRRILIDKARLKGRKLHRGEMLVEAPEFFSRSISDQAARELIDLHEALEALQKIDSTAAQVAEMRVFTGVTLAEVAEMLGISPSQAFREWSFARAWLKSQLSSMDDVNNELSKNASQVCGPQVNDLGR